MQDGTTAIYNEDGTGDTDDDMQATNTEDGTAREYYLRKGNSKTVLLAMCLGSKAEDPKFCDPEEDEVYKNARQRNSFVPKGPVLKEEVIRRSLLYTGKEQRCKSWAVAKVKEWLKVNPITGLQDLAFLTEEEEKYRTILNNAATERNLLAETQAQAWIGNAPWLRLAHAVLADEVVEAYKSVNDWNGRELTDARNSTVRPRSFEELCANKYNDPTFCPKTMEYGELHDDYLLPIDLPHEDAPMVTAGKIKDKLSHARCELMKMIADWEKSGNGEGQRNEDSEDLGHIVEGQRWYAPGSTEEEPEFVDGDNRKNFLRGRGSHLLYFWQIFDDNAILYHTLAKLPNQFCASSEGVPSTIGGSRAARRQREEEERLARDRDEEFKTSVATSMHSMARSDNFESLRRYQNDLLECKIKHAQTQCETTKQILEDQITEFEGIVRSIKESV